MYTLAIMISANQRGRLKSEKEIKLHCVGTLLSSRIVNIQLEMIKNDLRERFIGLFGLLPIYHVRKVLLPSAIRMQVYYCKELLN